MKGEDMKKYDLNVGDVVYLHILPNSNLGRRINKNNDPNDKIKEGIVTKVGNKYIHVKVDYGERKFDIHNNYLEYSDFSADYQLYPTKDAVLKKIAANEAYTSLQNVASFRRSQLPDEMLLEIEQIFNKYNIG